MIYELILLEYEQVISILKMFSSLCYPAQMKVTPINGTLYISQMQVMAMLIKTGLFSSFMFRNKSVFESFQGSYLYLGFQGNGL